MTSMSDLSEDLVGEILSRVPLTSLSLVRSTWKNWNALSYNQIFGNAAVTIRKEFLGFMLKDFRFFSVKFDLQGIRNDNDFVDPSIKQINVFNQVMLSEVFHCDGLLLCVTRDHSRLMVWNPYLGQIRWIRPMNNMYSKYDIYALGYDNNNRNHHKILRFVDNGNNFEIYEFNSKSWRVLDVTPEKFINLYPNGVSLKGNTYFRCLPIETEDGLICFDFTTERFGSLLPLPLFHYDNYILPVTLSCVGDEKLAVLCQFHYEGCEIIQIWITTTIEPNAVSWSSFLKVNITPLKGFPDDFLDDFEAESFFIDEEKKVVVVSNANRYEPLAYIIGEDGYLKSVTGKPNNIEYYKKVAVFSSYVPSLVQVGKKRRKRKIRDY